MFYTVGMLREILKNYSDDTTLYVDGTPGLVFFDEEKRWIELRNMECNWDDCPELESPTGEVDYMDF